MATINDAITGLGTTEVVRELTETRSGVTYVGRSRIQSASTSESVWQIYRTTEIGNLQDREYAGLGYYNQIWDDRTTLFGPDAAFTNAASTNFDGVNDYLNAGDNLNFDNATAWSFSFWIKANNVTAFRTIWAKVTNDANVFGIGVYHTNTGAMRLQMRASGQLRVYDTPTYSISALNWAHVVVTYNGAQNINGGRIYINDQVDSAPSSGTLTNTLLTSESATFGRRNAGFYFSGNLDEMAFFDKALSAAEVTELYNSGTPANIATSSVAGNLTNYWRMGDVDTHPTIYDQAGTVDLTMFNMSAADFESDVP